MNITVISGSVAGISGPVRDIIAEPDFFDIRLGPGTEFSLGVREGYMAAAYVTGGFGSFDPGQQRETRDRTMVLFGRSGTSVQVHAGPEGLRFFYLSGKPLGEPVAWGGPIVMNTEEELTQAFEEYRNGTFLRKLS